MSNWLDLKLEGAKPVCEVGALKFCIEELERENAELKSQVGRLRESASEAQESLGFLSHHLRGRMGEAALMDMAEKADALKDALKLTPTQCLAEIRAQAGRDGYEVGWDDAIRCIDKDPVIYGNSDDYANQIRQQAKAGEL